MATGREARMAFTLQAFWRSKCEHVPITKVMDDMRPVPSDKVPRPYTLLSPEEVKRIWRIYRRRRKSSDRAAFIRGLAARNNVHVSTIYRIIARHEDIVPAPLTSSV
jgi:hypothetical protein